jgi:hypothetical protein
MKILITSLITFILFISVSNAQNVSVDNAYKILSKNDILLQQKNVYYAPKILAPNEKITNFQTNAEVTFDKLTQLHRI